MGLACGTLLLPLLASGSQAAPPAIRQTTEPSGNPALDQNMAAFEFAPLVTTELTPSLTTMSGPGGNMCLLTAPHGVLLVDSGVHPTAAVLARRAAALAGKPVTTVVNTH